MPKAAVHGAHLVSHRTNAADPRRDVGHVLQGTAAKKRLEQAGRFVDVQAHVFDGAVAQLQLQGALAFYSSECFDADCPPLVHDGRSPPCSYANRSPSLRNSGANPLKLPRKARIVDGMSTFSS